MRHIREKGKEGNWSMPNVRRLLSAVLSATLVLSMATACDPEEKSDNGHSTERRPGAGAQHQPPAAQPGAAQPAPAQADPNAHNTEPGEVDLHVSWFSVNQLNKPLCEWSKNGARSPCANMADAHKEGNQYIGLWEYTDMGKSGDTYTLNAEGLSSKDDVTCEIFYKGQGHPGHSERGKCGASFTIP